MGALRRDNGSVSHEEYSGSGGSGKCAKQRWCVCHALRVVVAGLTDTDAKWNMFGSFLSRMRLII